MNSINVGTGGSGVRNASEGGSDYGFASPSVAQSGFEKPVLRSTSGRSTPRLVKISRKQGPFPKGRSAAVSDSDFNPFRSVSEGSNRFDEDGGMQELGDRYQSWKPFASSDSGERIIGSYSSASSISGHFEFRKSNGASGFVFGANSSSSTSNTRAENSGIGGGAGVSLPQEMQKLNIGNGAEFQCGKGANSSSNNVPEKGAFVFGSRSDKNSSLDTSKSAMLVDELRKLNLKTPRDRDGIEKNEGADLNSEANVEKTFVFVNRDSAASSVDGNADSMLQDEMKNLSIGESGKSGGFDKTEDSSSKVNHKDNFATFVFGSRKKNYVDSSGGSCASMLPDQMKKLNIQASVNRDGVEKTEDANFKVNEKNTFIFGSDTNNTGCSVGRNVNKVPNKMHNGCKFGEFGYESIDGVKKTEDANFKVNERNTFSFGSDRNHADYFVESNVNKLPSRMEKLHNGSKTGDSGGCASTSSYSSSSSIFLKDRDPGNSSDNIFKDPANDNTIKMPTTFQAASWGGNLRTIQDHSTQPNENSKPIGAFASSYSSSSDGPTFETVGEDFEATSMDGAGKKADPFSTSTAEQFLTHHTDFSTPKRGPSTRGNFDAGLNQKSGFNVKRGQTIRTKPKNGRGKSRQPRPLHHWAGENYVPKDNTFEENPETPGHYSPMDFSPYEEALPPDQSSRETSVASEEYFNLDGNFFSKDTYPSVPEDGPDEDLVSATRNLDINENDFKSGELNEKGARDHFERDVGSTCSFHESFSGAESECLTSKTEKVAYDTDASVAVAETEVGFDPNTERQENDGRTQFCFASLSEDVSDTNFTFAASSSSQGHFSAAKRFHRKKNRMKVGCDSYCSSNVKKQFESSSAHFFPLGSSSLHFGTVQNQMGDSSTCHSIGEKVSEADKNSGVKQQSVSRDTEISASQQACEKWRLRGNQAYADGNLSKAEEYYTQGVNCVSPNEMSKSCPRALMLCYSNRAVVRMAAGRMREALGDCRKAAEIDSEFLKAQVRAANCHLALGEVEDAIEYFKKILPSGDVVCLDRKTAIEASTGIQKAQQMANYLDCCTELFCRKTYKDAESALQIIAEALLISPYSEKLLQMKAEALLVLRKYSELIQLCERSLEFAEKNSDSASGDGQLEKINGSESIKICSARLWRWCMISKSYFYLGKLEEALEFLEKLEQAVSVAQKYGSNTLESSITLAVTIRELLRHKIAGNEAFQSGRHSEAVEHYTAALSCNVESRPFAAICFCNRAAAYQALGQITDAIADCSLAIALDGNYPKAISRRATLHEMIRDYGQAVSDLQKLIFLLEKQTEEKPNPSGTLTRSTSCANDLKQAQMRLSAFEEEARKGIPLNMYLILGVEPSGTASEIKKAYRKAALRHHPDKAGQFLARNENGDDGLWKDIAEEVHKDADRLFKMIGEAYAVLSDPTKRSRYDLEEESRNAPKKGNGFSSDATPSDAHSYPFERSGNRRQWQQDVRRSYRSQSQWSEAYRPYRHS